LIHGFPNFWYVWKNQFQALVEAGYHVVAPDLRGYNSSSKPKGIQAYDRRSVVSDMVRLIDELGGGKPATVVSVSFTTSLISLPLRFHNSKVEDTTCVTLNILTYVRVILGRSL